MKLSKSKIFKKVLLLILILFIVYWIPFLIISFGSRPNIASSIDQIPYSDAILVFGASVTENNEVTPLLKERLDAGKAILSAGKGNKIVVSNTAKATNIMLKYLESEGVPLDKIELDTQADKTTDTCAYEKKVHPENRKVIFVSQGFHLPRLLFQCKKIGVQGIAFPAESLGSNDRPQYSLFVRISTKTSRYIREAGLTWLSFLNIYK